MPLELNGARAVFTGHAVITDAELLLDWLRIEEAPVVDLRACPSAHMSVLQVLLAARPEVILGAPDNDWRALLTEAGLPLADPDTQTSGDCAGADRSEEAQT